ncbi:ABC transporter ATP-binding protein [Lactobacillus delbrueckii subsp. allosunkii]|uniref:ABC transporter ATP-binding protein/permease n=3 Tax=Lactobacillus delbrueckii TaxID=1584 RepID=A0ABD4SFA0_9LACO|nr:ABC transporter ATP-binding protein [Lactobacillus delbrueckii]EFK31884.1 ABC transporter, ATP-binding protein [Lactobacillus delbrueckii subsp. bulgaricus PB2003/044-T3-4]MCD5518330.1 ABC transporter ATP-binding protein/permease [Lactobacillus delbrueckii subsp. sunkii]MCZ0776856.1 ABC transporter ATP-binding protein [Lactobacillus delbrueckii subsp. sunkii]MCZ0788173.1 ABC transporter ATP-binding protein [Lactobacillus delbrueckii subsp. sunkii]MCZ0794407.1 ABC transporter ATP-binding pro
MFSLDLRQILAILLSCLATALSLKIPLLLKQVIDHGKMLSRTSSLGQIGFCLLISSLLEAVSQYLLSLAGDERIRDLRLLLQEKLLRLPWNYYKENSRGSLLSHVLNDSSVVKDFTVSVLPSALVSLLTVAASLEILLGLDVKMTLVIVLTFALIASSAFPLGKINEHFAYQNQAKLSRVSADLDENLANIKLIKLTNAQAGVLQKFRGDLQDLFALSRKTDAVFSVTGPLQTVLTLAGFLLILLYGSQRLANGSLSLGMLSSFIMYMFGIISPINNLGNFYMSYAEARGSLKAISEILAQPDEADPGQELPKKAADLKVRDLTFAYPGSQSPVLRDLSLDFKEGAKTALVGPSGAGKTTLINLLTRLEAGYQGQILLGDLEARNCSLPAWRDLFSVVAQDNNIFAGTVADNLLFGLEKSVSRSDMIQALQVANLWPELDLDTQTGEGGWKLSLGQSQRLQLARAYLRDAPCLILDEATANLDPESEAKVSQAVDRIAREKIVIIIAHRLSTIANADKIYFLDQGQVQAAGRHEELLKHLPKYRAYVEDQLRPLESR